MGFIFNLFFALIVLPGSGILLLLAILFRARWLMHLLLAGWVGIGLLVCVSLGMQAYHAKVELDAEDYRGTWVIDRRYFKGPNTDWQYHHYRFKVTPDDSLHLFVTDGRGRVKEYRRRVGTVSPQGSARLVIFPGADLHPLLRASPATYRTRRDFQLVLHGPFGNMFFRKEE